MRPDAVIATGRSDFPNQVNNVLCFPFIFRGALDAGATRITRPMELAAVRALADLAHAEQSEIVAMAYGGEVASFGPTLDAANIAFNLLKTAVGDGITVGPILLGSARPAHILTSLAGVRRIANMTALSVVDAGAQCERRMRSR